MGQASWTKIGGGEWGVKLWDMPAAKAGDEVPVSNRRGDTKVVTLGPLVSADRRVLVFAVQQRQAEAGEFRFTKIDEKWAVKAPADTDAVTGDTVEVTKKDGATTEVTLAQRLDLDTGPVFLLADEGEFPTPEVLPAGRYAIPNDDGELRFYHVWRGSRNPSYVNVYVLHGGESTQVGKAQALSIANKIEDAGPAEAAIRYGKEIGECSVCAARLTNNLSRALGIGPVCGGRFYEDEHWSGVKAKARTELRAQGIDPTESTDVLDYPGDQAEPVRQWSPRGAQGWRTY